MVYCQLATTSKIIQKIAQFQKITFIKNIPSHPWSSSSLLSYYIRFNNRIPYFRYLKYRFSTNIKNMASQTTRELPVWYQPGKEGNKLDLGLKIYNTLTKEKVPFIPQEGNLVKWYNCGPTVYDASHMGHARNYVTVDIIRRILQDYFGYNVQFIMNITDIDDKIIIRARQNYLFGEFLKQLETSNEDTLKFLEEAIISFLKAKFDTDDWKLAEEKSKAEGADPKLAMNFNAAVQAKESFESFKKYLKEPGSVSSTIKEIILPAQDVIASYLDKQKGSDVTDPKIFRDLAAYWEKDFMADMEALNVLPADVLTRVSEYVPEIVQFVEKIIANGYGYEVDGSVYFDTSAFDKHPDHYYAKLEPNSANNTALIEDGEGSLGAKLTGKKNVSDFALWKKSKAGEPYWPSPWGNGRPGWHIECSAMASDIFGANMDIHSGGEDLAFPHHDNELAQSEAHHGCKQWVNYFLHTGHLHIEGQKMSKSLKNFITIKEALKMYSARQLRLTFLMHQWDSGMDFKASSMEETVATEKLFNNFLINAKALIHEVRSKEVIFNGNHQFHENEKQLLAILNTKQHSVHQALSDSFNTPLAIKELSELVNKANIYIASNRTGSNTINADLISKIAKYVTRILSVFGLSDRNQEIGLGSSQQGGANVEETVMPYLQVLSKFRDQIRSLARNKADNKEILSACDQLRDIDLVELGVLLDDREDGKALVKLVDKEELIKERDAKLKREEEKRKKKEAANQAAEIKRLERLVKGKTPPSELFKTSEFSKWDEEGIPTHDANGEELPKSRRKKLVKEIEAQKKLHEEYLKSLA